MCSHLYLQKYYALQWQRNKNCGVSNSLHQLSVTKSSTFLNFIKHFMDSESVSTSPMEKRTFLFQEPVWAQHFSITPKCITPFLDTSMNTLPQHVLSHQPMQVWFNSNKKEGNTPLFISRAQSYIKVLDWQEKGQFSLLLTSTFKCNLFWE